MPAAEQIGPSHEMGVQQVEHVEESGLDLRRGHGVGADEPDPVHHAGADLAGESGMFLLVGRRPPHPRDPSGRRDLVDVAGPAIVEHPFVAPLVAEFLDQGGNEVGDRVLGMDRGLRKKLFEPVDDRRGVLNA